MATPSPTDPPVHEPIDTIIHIGAGRCRELPEYLAAQPERIILIEPQPDRARELRRQTAGHDHVTVIEAAVAGPESGNQLHVFNQRDFASLRPPTGLLDIFPGLRTTREIEGECMAPKAVLEHEDVSGQDHWLIIDAPGEEAAIVSALASEDWLHAFTRIDLHCGAVNLYEGDQPAADLLRQLADHGHEVEATDTETDPGRPHWALRRNTLKLENLALQRQLEAREEELTREGKRAQELATLRDERTRERDKARESAYQERIQADQNARERDRAQEAADQAKAEVERLNRERDQAQQAAEQARLQLEAMEHERDNASQAKDDAEQKLEALTQKRDEFKETEQKLRTELENLKTERDEARQAKDGTEQKLEARTQERDEFKETEQKLRTELENLKTERDEARQAKDGTEQKLEALTQERDEFKEAERKLRTELENLKTERDEARQAKDDTEQKLEARTQERDEFKEKVRQLRTAKEGAERSETDKDATIARLSEQLAALQQDYNVSEDRFNRLEEKLGQLFVDQRTYIQQTTNALGQHITRSSREQSEREALLHYMRYGERPVRADELPPGLALALLEQRDARRHDVIVVFGSPAVTELFARAIMNEYDNTQRLPRSSTAQASDASPPAAPSSDDLPQAILSLEHQKTGCKDLERRLHGNHCHQAVNIVHAPWIESCWEQQVSLFYACEAALQRLCQWLRDDARVLVVIGETLPHAQHSRIAALPQLLQHLPTQSLDVVLHGTHYPQEEVLAEEWEALLTARQRNAQWLTIPQAVGLSIQA